MKIKDIYAKYKIPLNLQEHMLRVAAVGEIISDNWIDKTEIKNEDLIKALLLHDTGNIIKYDLDNPIFDKADIPAIQKIQQEYKSKYSGVHEASETIAKEIGLSSYSVQIIADMGLYHAEEFIKQNKLDQQIACYADYRVDPYGVVSGEARIEDLYLRYHEKWPKEWSDDGKKRKLSKFLLLEKALQAKTSISLKDISDKSIETYIVQMAEYVIY